MGRMHIDDLHPGMVLSRDINSPNGRLLAAAGSTLADKHLRVMRIWGVTEAEVEGSDQAEPGAAAKAKLDPQLLVRAESHVDACFELSNKDSEAMAELRRLTVLRTAERLSSKAGSKKPAPPVTPHLPPEISETPPATPLDLVRMEVELASLPDIYFQIIEVIRNPNSSATHMAEVVGRDTNLSARLLRLVNSPFYGLPSAVDSLTRAVTLIGVKELSTLAMGISTLRHFQGIPPEIYDMKSFWRHSLLTSLCGKVLAGYKQGLSEERFFVAGLLHDVGRLVMVRHFPESSAQAIFETLVQHITLQEAEELVFGYDHGQVTGALLSQWSFPESLARMTAFHHSPEKSPEPDEAFLLHVADVLAHAMAVPADPYLRMPKLSGAAWNSLGLRVSNLATIMRQVDHLYQDLEQPLFGT